MKAALVTLVTTLLFVQLCAFSAEAKDYTLQDLDKESLQYSIEFAPAEDVIEKPSQAELLQLAGQIMTEQNSCWPATSLYRQAASFGIKRDAGFWIRLAEAYSCAKKWRLASLTGYLGYLNADQDIEKKAALLMTGMALEKRVSYSDNWIAAAIEAYSLALELEKMPDIQKRVVGLQHQNRINSALKINKSTGNADGGSARLCLRFNDHLLRESNYGDYIRITPALKADFSVDYQTLCIGGATFNTTYQITVRKGLKSEDKILADTVRLSIDTGHAPPALWFNQNDYVLASPASPAIGIHTMNVNTVQMQLYRIDERNILGDFVRENFREKLGGYELETLKEEVGEQVWEGTAEIKGATDKQTAGSLVLPEEILSTQGLYVLVATADTIKERSWDDRASQWLVVTDIGLTSYQGSDGLTVLARSLETALPLAGIEIALYARNNSPLATLHTDENGLVRFSPGLLQGRDGRRAVQLVATDKKYGFTFLSLNQAPFDLSDRGVAGRAAPGILDAYVYSDRGIYRPGETVHIVALLRDQLGNAVQSPPLTLRMEDPMAKITLERVLTPDSSGGYSSSVTLDAAARTGHWKARLYVDTDEKPIGRLSFQVNAFKPPRLEVRLAAAGIVTPETTAAVTVQADYLYGSPGSDLNVDAWLNLRYDAHPFADYQTYWFGVSGKKTGLAEIELPSLRTDEQGQAVLPLELAEFKLNSTTLQPLKAVLRAEVSDIDGRVVTALTELPVRHLRQYVGVKPVFSDQQVQADSKAGFEVVALDGQGQVLADSELSFRLIREEIDYQWFREDGIWGYERIIRDHEEQRAQLRTPFPAAISLPVGQGRYRLELYGQDQTALLTSFRFTAGEQLVGRSDSPDAVKVTLDRKLYQVGETAKLTIQAPYPGQASLVLAGTAVRKVMNFSLTETDNRHTLEIPVLADWGAGVYAMVTVYKPADAGKGKRGKGANRAVGLVWLGVDPAAQRLEVAINSPDQTRPRQTLEVPVTVRGAAPGAEVRLTMAAVDDGVLQLTGFTSPDPLAWFFGKQQLGLEIRDLYGQLITAPNSKPLILRTGAGDDEELRGAPESNIKVVSLFSGVVQVGADGQVNVPLTLPDFNGRLRLMAVAWSREKLGAASHNLQVNDPVVISPSLPRYLARDDQSTVQVLLDNVDGPEGEYHLEWSTSGALIMEGDFSADVTLERGKRQSRTFPVFTDATGKGNLHLQVSGPEGYSYAGDFALNVRDKYLPELNRIFSTLEPGDGMTLDHTTVRGLVPVTAGVTFTVASSPNLDVVGLLEQLDRYPYGCLEQLTSRAMPLLHANLLASRYNAPFDGKLDDKISKAIEAIFQKQLANGSFNLWNGYGSTESWLSAYAMDFMSRAGRKGYSVPDYFYNKGMDWLAIELKNMHEPEKEELADLTYAAWVLARAGRGRLEDSRYLFDNYLAELPTPLAHAQLAGAMALQGDLVRAEKGFRAGLQKVAEPGAYWHNYGSRLRDLAAIISVLHESGLKTIDPAPVWQELTRQLAKEKYLSTQEQAWLIMAALTLGRAEPLQLDLLKDHGRTVITETDYFSMNSSGISLLAKPVTIRNNGNSPVWVVTTVQGAPVSEPAPVSAGFSVRRDWYSMDGKLIRGESINQGDLVVVVVEGKVARGADYKALLVDLLPAGFEIEKARIDPDYDKAFFWLDELSRTRYVDGLDDRFIAAFDTDDLTPDHKKDTEKPFRVAYLVRAVTPGTYTVPPVEVEAMYQPAIRGRSKAAGLVIEKQ
jgi:uncharacterized protein YfaS (alpha-2-macroglobulin family)